MRDQLIELQRVCNELAGQAETFRDFGPTDTVEKFRQLRGQNADRYRLAHDRLKDQLDLPSLD